MSISCSDSDSVNSFHRPWLFILPENICPDLYALSRGSVSTHRVIQETRMWSEARSVKSAVVGHKYISFIRINSLCVVPSAEEPKHTLWPVSRCGVIDIYARSDAQKHFRSALRNNFICIYHKAIHIATVHLWHAGKPNTASSRSCNPSAKSRSANSALSQHLLMLLSKALCTAIFGHRYNHEKARIARRGSCQGDKHLMLQSNNKSVYLMLTCAWGCAAL